MKCTILQGDGSSRKAIPIGTAAAFSVRFRTFSSRFPSQRAGVIQRRSRFRRCSPPHFYGTNYSPDDDSRRNTYCDVTGHGPYSSPQRDSETDKACGPLGSMRSVVRPARQLRAYLQVSHRNRSNCHVLAQSMSSELNATRVVASPLMAVGHIVRVRNVSLRGVGFTLQNQGFIPKFGVLTRLI